MKTIAHTGTAFASHAQSKSFSLDTTFVLFFLSLELGRTLTTFSFDVAVMGVALVVVAAAPYLFPGEERPEFGIWISGRAWIASFGIGLGVLFNQTIGTVLPEMLRFAPMALLIVASILSCQIQFYKYLRVRA